MDKKGNGYGQTIKEKLEMQKRKDIIGENIRLICRREAITHKELAEGIYTSLGNLQNVLYGGRYSYSLLERVEEFLGVTEETLTDEKLSRKLDEKKVYLESNIWLLCMLNSMDYTDISSKSGIASRTVADMAKGKYTLRSSSLARVAKVFGITKQKLLYYDFTRGRKEKLGKNLYALRIKKKMGRGRLAIKEDVNERTIKMIEIKAGVFKPKELERLANALEVTVEELIFGKFD